MMKFFNKLKNNKGSVESAMFVFGIAVFATIVVFSMDMLGLTWQRYLSTRELSNMSRLYAIRATDLYWEEGSSSMTSPGASSLGQTMGDMLEVLVDHGKLTRATLTISDAENGGNNFLTITTNNSTDSVITGTNWDRFKQLDYGATLYAKLKIEYRDSGITGVARADGRNRTYTIINKFAFEGSKATNDKIG